MLRRVGVRARIIVASLTMVVAVVAGLGFVVWRAMVVALETTAHESAVGMLATISRDLRTEDPRVAVPPDVLPFAHRLQQVLDAQGQVVAWSSERARTQPLAELDAPPPIGRVVTVRRGSPEVIEDGRVVIAASRVLADDGRLYTVLVSEPTHVQEDAGRRLTLTVVAMLGAALAALTLVLRFAVASALDPVEQMSHDLESITSSREARSIHAPDRSDEIGRLGRSINALLLRLRQSDERRAGFVADAGHELRSPLTTIGLSLDQLGRDLSPERRAVVTQRAVDELARLTKLTEDLLALAKADESADLVGATDLDLDDIALHETGILRAKGERVDLDLVPARVHGVEDELHRVVRNLLDNAQRHARSRIRVSVWTHGDHAVLDVDNDGALIPATDRERVFDRFVRLDEARARGDGGSGLGLPIVRELVVRHGGTVSATEAPDGWCRFRVWVPLVTDPLAPPERAADRRALPRAPG